MGPRVLIADDDRVFVLMVSKGLKAKGFEISVAYDGMQAMMGAVRAVPDVILLDVNMPGGDGIGTLQKLRASTKTSQIPIVVTSSVTDPGLPQRVMDLGATGFIQKPTNFGDLYLNLCRFLGREPQPDTSPR